MAKILPSSDLRNKYNEISNFCNTSHEPVYITKNGKGDLVVLSNTAYEELTGRSELHRLLNEGLSAMKAGGGRPACEVFNRPFAHSNDDFVMEILKDLVSQGLSGDELLTKFAEARKDIKKAVGLLIDEADEIAMRKRQGATTNEIFVKD